MAKKEEQITEEVVAVDIKRFIVEDFDKFNDKENASRMERFHPLLLQLV